MLLNGELSPKGKSYVLADILDVMDMDTLSEAKGGRYLLALSPKGLDGMKAGWHQVMREPHKAAYLKSVTKNNAIRLMREGKWHDVLYVDQCAMDAKQEGRPIALDAFSGQFLFADEWPDCYAIVALAELKPEELLRRGK